MAVRHGATEAGEFTPSAEIGLRHDGGDAETGTGIEIGAGLRYVSGPVTVEAQARTLVAHEDSDYEEWGMSGAIRVTLSASGRGLTLSIAPAWGQTGSAAERLWSGHDARALGADSEFEAGSRLELDNGVRLRASEQPGRAHALRWAHPRGCREPHGAHRHPLAVQSRYRRQR